MIRREIRRAGEVAKGASGVSHTSERDDREERCVLGAAREVLRRMGCDVSCRRIQTPPVEFKAKGFWVNTAFTMLAKQAAVSTNTPPAGNQQW